jgi:hypothetical protein
MLSVGEFNSRTQCVFGDPRALPVRESLAQSPSVAMADQAHSHGSGSYHVDAHEPVAGG